MRHYPVNSPMASARILALAANSQGRLSRSQMEAVRYLGVLKLLELEPEVWHQVLTSLYTDLLPFQQRSWSSVFQTDAKQLDKVLDEVDDPKLRFQVYRLSTALARLEGDVGQQNPVRDAIEQRWEEAQAAGPDTKTDRG